ncbi:gamma-glutamyltransferase [Candidatus Nitrosacidococcus tergens]|uniref:Glutathione hydrolase proenzyme n=1 Tax=Candidatus Nitrosacidococcus tergens TaxID=553981 RepID=A0A7G1QAW7_9GAMM|nr:gamma-glutamyltransferase [Candidatus Nitrosacidococcus tergens]CAB1276731.1 Gamma-glutamyltranspeptidase [Candidatus Nitrosacidococcus tergens]
MILRSIFTFILFILLFIFSGLARSQGKPPKAAIASAHPLATQAGAKILREGGNAFDAAVAISAALAVVEPYSSGIGGGGFWLLHRAKDNKDIMIDGRERAPLAASPNMYLDKHGSVRNRDSVDGPLAAAIPGLPAALDHLTKNYGRLSLRQTLAPAISYAQQGFEANEHFLRMVNFRLPVLKYYPNTAQVFLKNGAVPQLGAKIKQSDLANTLTALAEHGATGFYQGNIANKLVSGVKTAGGIWTLEDLAQYKVLERSTIKGKYHKATIISASPPSAGGIALMTMLNTLNQDNFFTLPKVSKIHLTIEAMRRSYRDRAEYLGDPDFIHIPMEQLIHPYYGAGLRSSISLNKATPSNFLSTAEYKESGQDTTHFSIIDQEGNWVAATLSINYPFGSGFIPAGTGVLLNDEMDDFSISPGVPNVYGLVGNKANEILPRKRPLSSMTPTFVVDNHSVLVLGAPGGSRIITMVLLGILNHMEGKNLIELVSAPRFHHQYLPDEVEYEPKAFSPETIKKLQTLGHHLKANTHTWGNMQAVFWDWEQGIVDAASDPRGTGEALVQ